MKIRLFIKIMWRVKVRRTWRGVFYWFLCKIYSCFPDKVTLTTQRAEILVFVNFKWQWVNDQTKTWRGVSSGVFLKRFTCCINFAAIALPEIGF